MICAVVYSHNTLQEQRNGLQDGGTYGLVDNLTYTYNGNQLAKISDGVEDPTYVGAFNFKDGADSSTEYTYDAVGNMTSDKNKGITSITYNVINQPQKITFSDGKTTEYVYSYDGTKLQTIHKTQQPQTSATTTYCGNMIYENGALKQMLVDGGYVTFSGATPVYHFYIQDHLGNNRVVAKANGTVEQINHYYPYGGMMADICTGSDVQPYKYNGKELDRMHGLDTYDYGARQHNAATERWDRIDKLAEENPEVSPYVYCGNNPVNRIDLDGNDYWYTNDINQIESFINAVGSGQTQFDFSDWNHATDADFCGNLTYNDETHKFYTSYASIIDGELTVTGKSFDANLTPVSFSGEGYEGAFVYKPIKNPLLKVAYLLEPLVYDGGGRAKWKCNTDGRIIDVAPITGMAPIFGTRKGFGGGKQKMGHAKRNMPGDHDRQNKQVESLAKKHNLDKDEKRILHDEISNQGFGYHEIEELIHDIFGK